MYAEGETELRDLIIQNLETSGFLNKIKAELRAGVFIAFEDENKLKAKNPLGNKKLEDFINTSSGKLVVSLVREFLEHFNLNFTLSVFDPETSIDSPLNRSDLCDKLNLKNSEVSEPIISTLLKNSHNITPKEIKQPSNGAALFPQPTNLSSLPTKKSLETISEDNPTKEIPTLKDATTTDFSTTFNLGNDSSVTKSTAADSIATKPSTNSPPQKSGSDMIDKLRSEHRSFELTRKQNEIFGNDKNDTDIFKVHSHSADDLDNFFDEPLPSQKTSLFGDNGILSKTLEKPASNFLPAIETTKPSFTGILSDVLDSTTTTNKYSSVTNKASFSGSLSDIFDSAKTNKQPLTTNKPSFSEGLLDILDSTTATKKQPLTTNKSETEGESNEESSDRQLNSEESIEEEIEEDFSGGIDDLLNSSLSLGDDATTDQSASQASVVDGVDHMESVNA